MPKAAIPAARVSSKAISLPGRVLNAPVSAVSVVAALTLAPVGSWWALPAAGAAGVAGIAGAGVTIGNRLARLPAWLGADRLETAPGGNSCGGTRGPATPARGVGAPLAVELLNAGPERDGDGLGAGDALGEPDLLGEGEGEGDGDLLGEGEGLGEGDLLGEGEGLGEGDTVDRLGDGDGEAAAAAIATAADVGASAGLTAALALPAIAMRIPAAMAPPQARARAPARARPRMRPR